MRREKIPQHILRATDTPDSLPDRPAPDIQPDWMERLANMVAEQVAALTQPDQGHYDTDQAARHLGISRSSLETRLDTVPHFRVGRKRLFRPQELDEWLEKYRVRRPETDTGELVDEILEKLTRRSEAGREGKI